jgi:2-hydroxychromene-2-carboxylate isomerase
MAAPVEFYFDFSSPYGYLAAQQIDDVAARHGRTVAWRPFLLGVAFKQSGNRPLVDQPLKGAYSTHDMRRCARRLGVPFQLPATFPFMSVAACRAFYAVSDRDPAAAKDLARALYDAAFAQGRDISDAGAVLDIAQERGLDRARLAADLQSPAVKERLKTEVEAALERGVFGSPFFIVDDEPFWGHDRLDDVERWLASGGW